MNEVDIKLARRVMNILDEVNVEYFFKEETGTIVFGGIRKGIEISSLNFMIIVRNDSITAHAIAGMHADPEDKEQIRRLMRFLSIVNYSVRDGCFTMDVRDGEVQYRVYRDNIPDDDAWRAAVHEVIVLPAAMFRRYLKGMFLAMYGIVTPEDAVAFCEKDIPDCVSEEAQEEIEEPEDSAPEDDTEEEEPVVICGDDEDVPEEEENPYDYFVYKTKFS